MGIIRSTQRLTTLTTMKPLATINTTRRTMHHTLNWTTSSTIRETLSPSTTTSTLYTAHSQLRTRTHMAMVTHTVMDIQTSITNTSSNDQTLIRKSPNRTCSDLHGLGHNLTREDMKLYDHQPLYEIGRTELWRRLQPKISDPISTISILFLLTIFNLK